MRLPELRIHLHNSHLLRNNPLGDPHLRRLPVYVPPGYDPARKEKYPVIYLLAGWSGRGARYLEDGGAFSRSLLDALDDRIIEKKMSPVVVVFPDCTTSLGASQYINSIANGPYMDYLCDELVPFVEAEYHVHAEASFRGVIGHSSGGFGALVTAMIRPDVFRSLCSSAGDGFYELLYLQPIPGMVKVLKQAGGVAPFIEKFRASPNPMSLLSPDEGMTMMCLSICACYAPNLAVPVLKGDLYFDLETGEVVPEIWEKLLDWDPVRMVDRFADALGSLRWIHLEAGTDDEYGLHLAHRQLLKKLERLGIKVVINEYPGRHSGHHYRMPERIGRMLEAMPT